jgi:hypothetical protein
MVPMLLLDLALIGVLVFAMDHSHPLRVLVKVVTALVFIVILSQWISAARTRCSRARH